MSIKPNEFVHLHCHTDYSMLDGAARIDDLLAEVENVGQTAVAITDHGFLYGAYELMHRTQGYLNENGEPNKNHKGGEPIHNVKPIVGLEAYVTPGTSRHDKTRIFWGGTDANGAPKMSGDVSNRGEYTHMTLWAENNTGLHNLMWMDTLASLDNSTVQAHPRIDRDLMQTYGKGLIATSGCPSGAVQTRIRLGQYKEAVREASELQDIFGKENFFVELMDHGIDFERTTRNDLLKLAKDIGAPLVATNDLHYVKKEDAVAQDALLCISTNSNLSDPARFRFDGSGYYVKSAAEMYDLFKDLPEALDNTLLIAERCTTTIQKKVLMPKLPLPDGETEDSYFKRLVQEGLEFRYPNGIPENVQAQANFEIDTILSMGFPGYFIVVADFIIWAKNNGIMVGPGRGSAAGSMVAYAMRITDLDPLEHKLVFERFLNPERVSLPDIDVDFEEGGRERVIEYCAQKYGENNVAQIMTIGKIKSKQALKDSARIQGFEYSVGDRIAKAVPARGMITLIDDLHEIEDASSKHYAESSEFRSMISGTDPLAKNFKDTFELAKHIENLTRGWGVHASGVIVSPVEVPEVVPTMRRLTDGMIITQYDAHGCEDLGLVKMDFLGLKNLNTLKAALVNIKHSTGEDIDLTCLPLDDPKAFELIGRGDTLGVFQLDGGGMRELLREMKPDKFNDISATIALYRPGPMGMNSHHSYAKRKNGLEKITPIHPDVDEALSDILGDTYGVVVFQEQIQFAARKLANYTMGGADLLRRAMGKKDRDILDAEYANFEAGMLENGYTKPAVKAVWDVFQPFADYAFNRAHTAAYGMIAYYNAYLKANYPAEYMAALLTTFANNKDKLALYLNECRRMKIPVLPPDVNKSEVDFSANDNVILFGMGAIRNVGEGVAESIINTRISKGEYTSFNDFMNKVAESVCNKLKIESLIKAGAFDGFGNTRRSLMMIHDKAVDSVLPVKKKEAQGVFDLFSVMSGDVSSSDSTSEFDIEIPDVPEWDTKEKLGFEKQILGLYVSGHPLDGLDMTLEKSSNVSILQFSEEEEQSELKDGQIYTISGMITSVNRKISKRGATFAILTLENMIASMEISVFGKTFEACNQLLNVDSIVKVTGRVRINDTPPHAFSANAIELLNVTAAGVDTDLHLRMDIGLCSPKNINELQQVLKIYPGTTSVFLDIINGKESKTIALPEEYNVEISSSLVATIRSKFGNNIEF